MVIGALDTTRGNWRSAPTCHNLVEGHPVEHINLWKSIHGGDDADKAVEGMVELAACKGRAQYARNNVKAISAHYRGESKRLDEELERKAKGKEADLEVEGYIKRVMILVIPDTQVKPGVNTDHLEWAGTTRKK